MTRFKLFGFLLGIAAVAFLGYALFKGEVGLSQSQLTTDVKTISRADDPTTFYLIVSGIGALIVLYWVVLFWLLRTVLPRIAAAREES